MATVGVVSERVRMEEKQLLAALSGAGLSAIPFPPRPQPLPVAPAPTGAAVPRLLIDRGQNRTATAALLTAYRALGAVVLDAGLAARADRLAVAVALGGAGLPRPETRLAVGAEAALAALDDFGYPGTVLPLTLDGKAIALLDRDTAEAVLEHRDVLGASHDALALVQAGVPVARWSVMVVGGVAVGVTALGTLAPLPGAAAALAEQAAVALEATMIAVEVAVTDEGLIVWDVDVVPEFRHATAIAGQAVAAAVTELALGRLAALPLATEASIVTVRVATRRGQERAQEPGREVTHGVVLTA